MDVTAIASEIISALLSGLTNMVTQIPTAIKDVFEALFLTTTTSGGNTVTHVSTFAIVMLVFGGVTLAFGISKLIYNLVASKVGA